MFIGELNTHYRPRRHIAWTTEVLVRDDIAILDLTNDDGRHGIYLIDADDAPLVSQCRWQILTPRKPGVPAYAVTSSIKLEGKRVTMPIQRLICPGAVPGDKKHVDHLNGDVYDNRKANLELVSARVNQHRINRGNQYGTCIMDTENGTWKVAVKFREAYVFTPSFKRYLDAVAYREVVLEYATLYDEGKMPLPSKNALMRLANLYRDEDASTKA